MSAVVKLFSSNPTDGISTFDKARFYQANDSVGTGATLIGTEDIDITTADVINPGFTPFIYTTGSLTKYYASTWYDSVNLFETNKSTWMLGGQDRWDNQFKNNLKDTAEEVWDATDRSIFKKDALDALYPDLFREVIDDSLTIENDSSNATYEYTVPFGIFQISKVEIGYANTTLSQGRSFVTVKPDIWQFERNVLTFSTLSGMTNDYPIRLTASKKYNDVGEVPTIVDSTAMYHMRMSAYLQMADDFPRFKKWAQYQQGSKVSFENLRVHAREYERKFKEGISRIKNMALAQSTI